MTWPLALRETVADGAAPLVADPGDRLGEEEEMTREEILLRLARAEPFVAAFETEVRPNHAPS